MDCQTVQNQILGLPDPRELSPVLRQHVQTCPACQEWARRAARLEWILEQIPVPPAPGQKKEMMLGELMAADPVIATMPVPARRPGLGTEVLRFLRTNATYVGGLAAAVLVVVGIAWMLWPSGPGPDMAKKPQKHPLLEKLARYDVAMARADTTAKKLDVLDGMADVIANEARGMSLIASEAELKQMAGWYEDVVKKGMIARAGELQNQPTVPLAEKKEKLESLAGKLRAEAAETEKKLAESRQDAQPALKRIAEAAREGETALLKAVGGK
jgi:hypothetical protein